MSIDFSVVIPTFRRERELLKAIASVLAQQDDVGVEVFVVDDSPEGSAEEAVQSIDDPRVTYVRNPKPTGGVPSVVRNLGWPLATGSFVHFLDDDDIVAEGYYRAVQAAFAANPGIGLAFGRIEPFGESPAQVEHEREYFADAARKAAVSARFGSRIAFAGRMLFDKALLVCSSSVIRRSCLAKLGGFDPAIRLMEDADYHLRAMRTCGAVFLDCTAVHYRVGYPSLMHSPQPGEGQKQAERQGHRQMQNKYRNEHGALEFYALALFTRTVLKLF